MELRMFESRLPPGFRFYPSDEELVSHYLYRKVMQPEDICRNPGGGRLAPYRALGASGFRDRKYNTGSRTNRATKTGYWKATGKDRIVHESATQTVVGMRKTLVFYSGRAPNGLKSSWVMHEFRLESPHMPPKEDWVLCRVFHKKKEDDNLSRSHSLESVDSQNYSMPFFNYAPTMDLVQLSHATYHQLALRSFHFLKKDIIANPASPPPWHRMSEALASTNKGIVTAYCSTIIF